MKKSAIALAVAAAVIAAPSAMAVDVKTYAIAEVELTSIDPQSGTGDTTAVNDDKGRGRVGIKASQDLGNGWKAIANFEWKADAADNDTAKAGSGGSLTGRTSYVGLKGSAGTFTFGRNKQPYKYTGGVKYDAFVATQLQARGNGGMSSTSTSGAKGWVDNNSFISDTIAWKSKKMGAISVWIAMNPGDGVTNAGAYSAAAKFKQGGIEVFAAVADGGDNASGASLGHSASKIGGQFKSGPHKISIQSESMEVSSAADVDHLFIGYQMKMGKNTLVAQLGSQDNGTAASDVDYMAIGVIHKFTKKVRMFAGYRDKDAATASSGSSAISIGLRFDMK